MSLFAPLQAIVDSLAADIERDVAIDDRQIRWIVHSPHYGEPDAARLESILSRRVSDEAVEWAFSFGIQEAEGPVRLPANEAVGALARLCIPLRTRGLLLGFMFIVDPQASLSEDEVARSCSAAREAAEVLYRERRLRDLERERERWLLVHLLGDDAGDAEDAARALGDEGFLDARRVAVLVIRALDPGDRTAAELAIGSALERLRRAVPDRRGPEMSRPELGAFVVSVDGGGGASPRELAERLVVLADEEGPAGFVTRIGIGGTVDLVDARRSFRQGRDAVAVAERVERFGRIAVWDELGVYRTLVSFGDVGDESLHPGLVALLRDPAHAALVETVEAYLDRAGDAKATSEALSLHRATLYYRLSRVEEITGARLKSGEDRLALHLGLRLARLGGLPLSGT